MLFLRNLRISPSPLYAIHSFLQWKLITFSFWSLYSEILRWCTSKWVYFHPLCWVFDGLFKFGNFSCGEFPWIVVFMIFSSIFSLLSFYHRDIWKTGLFLRLSIWILNIDSSLSHLLIFIFCHSFRFHYLRIIFPFSSLLSRLNHWLWGS